MRKVVSDEDGYSLFLENEDGDIKCVAYETGRHMTGQEIADVLGITRSAVSQSLKKSIKFIYYKIKRNTNLSPVEVICIMAKMFNIKSNSQYKKFFRLFPSNIKGVVYAKAHKIGYCKN